MKVAIKPKVEFITKLELSEDNIPDSPYWRHFKAIDLGRWALSIQAHRGAYCQPRDVREPEEYTHMELGILNKDGEFLNARKSSVMRSFPEFHDLMYYYDGFGVYAYVPVELIEKLYQYLKSKV